MELDILEKIALVVFSTAFGVLAKDIYERRPRLVVFYGHSSVHRITSTTPPTVVHTHAVILKNVGRKEAKNVRLSHHTLPSFTCFPDVQHTVVQLPGGGSDIVLPSLVPGEQVTFSYLYFPPLTYNLVNGPVRSDEGFAKVLSVLPTPQLSKWIRWVLWMLILVGIIAMAYLAYGLAKYLGGVTGIF